MSFSNEVECKVPNRSAFNMTHKKRTSMQFDFIYPTLLMETLPDDKFKVKQTNVARFAPMLSPAFGDIKLYTHYFYVPRRIVEPYWKEFWTGKEDFGSISYVSLVVPYANCLNYDNWLPSGDVPSADGSIFGKQSLADYFGIKPIPRDTMICNDKGNTPDACDNIDLTPFIAYQYIYNEYYRDSQIDEDLFQPGNALWYLTRDGWSDFLREHEQGGRFYGAQGQFPYGVVSDTTYLDMLRKGCVPFTFYSRRLTLIANANFDYQGYEHIITSLFSLRKRCWYHDYFTSARQSIVSGDVPIVPVRFQNDPQNSSPITKFVERGELYTTLNTNNANIVVNNTNAPAQRTINAWNFGFTLSALRLANALQKFEEKTIRFGTRYIEQLASHFGVISSDASLQRPQFMGGHQSTAYVQEVSQTSASTNDSAQGNYAGQMFTSDSNKNDEVTIYSEEHGWLFGLTSVMVAPTYGDGLHKMWNRNSDRFNFYSPEFAALTDQTIRERELCVLDTTTIQNSNVNPNSIGGNSSFGYAPRWDEYRGMLDSYTGQFRDKLKYWHFGRKFATLADLYYRELSSLLDADVIADMAGNNGVPTAHVVVKGDSVRFVFEVYPDTIANTTQLNNPWALPVSYIMFNRALSAAEQAALDPNAAGFFCVVYEVSADDAYYLALTSTNLMPVDVPVLDSDFIHASGSLDPFALTSEFENIGFRKNIQRIGDDYIFCNFENEVLAVRPLPEQILPAI